MRFLRLIIILLVNVCIPLSAQELWTSASIKSGFGKHWGAEAEIEYRTHNQFKSSERVAFGISGEYKHKYFKIDAGYKFILGQTLEETTRKGNIIPPYWIGRHRYYASATGKISLGRFNLSLRERYQYTHRLGKWVPKFASDGVTPKDEEWIPMKDKHSLRSRVAADYNIRKSRFTPFISLELYNDLGNSFEAEKIRYTIGSEYKIDKHNRVELFYRFVEDFQPGNPHINVIGIGYSFKL